MARSRQFQLVIDTHAGRRTVPVQLGSITLGSDSASTIQLDHPSVAPHHAKIERTGARKLVLIRLDPDAELRVNDQPVA